MSNKLTNQITGASVFNSLYLGTTQKPEIYGTVALSPLALALGPVAPALASVALGPVALALGPVALGPVALAHVAPIALAPASTLFAKLTTEDALT
jgi:hypothetical protein